MTTVFYFKKENKINFWRTYTDRDFQITAQNIRIEEYNGFYAVMVSHMLISIFDNLDDAFKQIELSFKNGGSYITKIENINLVELKDDPNLIKIVYYQNNKEYSEKGFFDFIDEFNKIKIKMIERKDNLDDLFLSPFKEDYSKRKAVSNWKLEYLEDLISLPLDKNYFSAIHSGLKEFKGFIKKDENFNNFLNEYFLGDFLNEKNLYEEIYHDNLFFYKVF